MSSRRAASFKRQTKVTPAERRRQAFLEKQKNAKRDLTQHARELATGHVKLDPAAPDEQENNCMEDVTQAHSGKGSKGKGGNKGRRRDRIASLREHFSKQLMSSEWWVDKQKTSDRIIKMQTGFVSSR